MKTRDNDIIMWMMITMIRDTDTKIELGRDQFTYIGVKAPLPSRPTPMSVAPSIHINNIRSGLLLLVAHMRSR